MKIWIDNTGLQSAAQCLDGWADQKYDYDIHGLLQLATLIIYGNNITLNGFEDTKIANRSKEVIEKLRDIGISEDILSISQINEAEYALACKTAAKLAAQNLGSTFNPTENHLIGCGPPEVPRGHKERQISSINLALEPHDSNSYEISEISALRHKAIGAVEYMIATTQELRQAINKVVVSYPGWSDTQSYQLSVYLRYYLNECLGEQNFSKYAPSIARAGLISRSNQYILDALGKTVDDVVKELRGETLGIPSTLAALLQRSKGEPHAILEVAREFRELSKPLRDSLQELYNKFPTDSPESHFEIRQNITELGRQLRRDVGIDRKTRFGDAIEVRFIIGIPVVSLSGKELLKWVKEKLESRRTAVLTELVRSSSFSEMSSDTYKHLRKLSTIKHHQKWST